MKMLRRASQNNEAPMMWALTLRQPWASLVALGYKPIENRSWRPGVHLGTRISIHAGARVDETGFELADRLGIVLPKVLPMGKVIATVLISEVAVAMQDLPAEMWPWWRGPLAWVLKDPQQIDGPCVRGRLGLWQLAA